MLNTLKELCRLRGVSGDEDEVRRYIEEKAAPCADGVRTDALGNLIVFKKGKKPAGNRLMLAAHMDEVGIIITRITDEGFLKFGFVGGVDRRGHRQAGGHRKKQGSWGDRPEGGPPGEP